MNDRENISEINENELIEYYGYGKAFGKTIYYDYYYYYYYLALPSETNRH